MKIVSFNYGRRIDYFIYNHKIIIYCSIFFMACLQLVGCRKTENFSPSGVNAPLALVASDSIIKLNEANKANTAITFNWTTGSNYGSSSAISYYLQIDKKGNNFASALSNNIGQNIYTVNYSVSSLNTLLSAYWKASPDTAFKLEARVYTVIGDGTIKGDTSKSINITVTPYSPVSKTLYIIGDATAKGWDANAADSLTPDASTPGLFSYQATLTPGNFKFITTLGSFLPSYNKGADTAHVILRKSNSDPDNQFTITATSVYKIAVNLISLTITVSKVSGPTYTALWIVGDATPNGWNIDAPNKMKVDVFNPYVFNYNEVLAVGEFKIPTATGNWGGDFYRPLVADPPITDTRAALVLGSTNPPDNKWKISTAGPYKIALNTLTNTINITQFKPYTALWMVGDAAPNGWNISSPTSMVATAGDPYTFTYTGPLSVGEFKIPTATGNFSVAYFRPDVNHPALTDTNAPLVQIGQNAADTQDYKWQITVAGNYKVVFNQLYETISIQKQ